MAAPIAAVACLVLVLLAAGDPLRQESLVVYGLSLVLLFGFSAAYHIGQWSPPVRAVLRRLDHANIFLLIAGTYTPIAVNALRDRERVAVLVAVWLSSLIGIGAVVSGVDLPRWLLALLYMAVGWIAVLILPHLLVSFGGPALALLLLGGALYSAGALCYALQRPRLWQGVFGYHEVFHAFTIAAGAVFFLFIAVYIMPLRPA